MKRHIRIAQRCCVYALSELRSLIVELAEEIDSQWRMEDKAAAADAKAAAEAQLQALSAQDEVQPARIAARARVGAE